MALRETCVLLFGTAGSVGVPAALAATQELNGFNKEQVHRQNIALHRPQGQGKPSRVNVHSHSVTPLGWRCSGIPQPVMEPKWMTKRTAIYERSPESH